MTSVSSQSAVPAALPEGIRLFRPDDAARVSEICIRTGAHGEDATGLFAQPELLHLVYADPYVTHDPSLAFIAEDADGEAAGYLLATANLPEFENWREEHWLPPLREQYPLLPEDSDAPEKWLINGQIHGGSRRESWITDDFPAELHIDLLPSLQGLGRGRALIEVALNELRSRDVPGVHLGVSTQNEKAIGFYEHVGFERLQDNPGVIWMGWRL